MVKRKGRPRKATVRRDAKGKSRGEPPDVMRAVVLAQRIREVPEKDALSQLAGFTLGRLHLRWRADKHDPSGVTKVQYHAGEDWARIVRNYARIVSGAPLNRPRSLDVHRIGGEDCSDPPTDSEVAKIRDDWRTCYDALMEACRIPEAGGIRIRNVTYGVCVENWHVGQLSEADYGCLRVGLNALARALGKGRRLG